MFDVEEYHDLEMQVTDHSPCELWTICTSLKSMDSGLSFCHDVWSPSLINQLVL